MPKERVIQAEGTADPKALRQEQEKASEEAAERAQGGVMRGEGPGIKQKQSRAKSPRHGRHDTECSYHTAKVPRC